MLERARYRPPGAVTVAWLQQMATPTPADASGEEPEEKHVSTRMSVNITNQTARDLRELAERRDSSVTDVVGRSVTVYKFIVDEIAAGKTVQTVDRSGITTLVLE